MSTPEERARERRSWPVHILGLHGLDMPDLSETTTPTERMAMMWPLAVEAWTLAGWEFPQYLRTAIPVRVIPLRDLDRGDESGAGGEPA